MKPTAELRAQVEVDILDSEHWSPLDVLNLIERIETLEAVLAAARTLSRSLAHPESRDSYPDYWDLLESIHAADQSSAEPRCVTCNDTGEVGAVSGYVCSCAVGEKDGGGDE